MLRTLAGILAVFVGLESVSGSGTQAQTADSKPPRPNIVFFLADDLGFGDLACYGSEMAKTPRLDRLAREGTRFTQFYVSCVCSPTRATAITGHFPARHGIYSYLSFFKRNQRLKMPDWLDVEAPSLPRALQQAGYRTAMIGKWHLGGGSGSTWRSESGEIVINHPDAPAVGRYGFDHTRITYGNGPTWKNAEPWPKPHDTYPYTNDVWIRWSSRAIADETIAFLQSHATSTHRDQPFYINVWFKDVHTPHRPTKEMRGPFSHLDGKPQAHYAMLHEMDEQIGRVLDTLDELGMTENTLVLFSSDNGAAVGRGGSNGPLRGGKHTLYEGGVRVPLIVRWPGHVPAGRVDETSVLNIADFVPTLCRLTGARMPEGYASDGEDVSGALRGQGFERENAQFWYYPSAREGGPTLAIRDGDWKLLTDPDATRPELYDLGNEIGEAKNLAATHPDVVERLTRLLFDWCREVGLNTGQSSE